MITSMTTVPPPLRGLGASPTDDQLSEIADGLIVAAPAGQPREADIAAAMRMLDRASAQRLGQILVAEGISAQVVNSALQRAFAGEPWSKTRLWGWATVATLSAAASGFHGYRRNRSVGWGLWWFVMGSLFPVVTPTIALAQGFGKPKKSRK